MQRSSLLCSSSSFSPLPTALPTSNHFALPVRGRPTRPVVASVRLPLTRLRNFRHTLSPLHSTATEEVLETSKVESEFVEVGYISSVHGLQGEIRVKPNTDFPELRFAEPGIRWLRQQFSGKETIREVELVEGRGHPGQKTWILKFGGIDTVEEAKQLVGSSLLVREDDRPELEEGEFYSRDLLGMRVTLKETGEPVGTVVNVFSTGANDLLQVMLDPSVKTPDHTGNPKSETGVSGPLVWVPFVEAIVPNVDMNKREMQITPPKGLLELNLRSHERSKKERRQLEWKQRRKFQRRLIAAKKKLHEMEQQHVFHGFRFGQKAQRSLLADQIVGVNSKLLQQALQNIELSSQRWSSSEFISTKLTKLGQRTLKVSKKCLTTPGSEEKLDSNFELQEKGLHLMSKGKMAIVLFVNDSEKHGRCSVPELVDSESAGNSTSFLQTLLSDDRISLKKEDRVSVPLIMVSPAHEVHSLENLFSNHDHFAFDPKKVWLKQKEKWERERERENERERGGVRESEGACDGDDNEIGEASRRRSFTVESKIFELALDGRKGRSQIRIVEKKRGVSTWIRLGLESLGLFKKGLLHCIRDENEGRWETEWRDRGKRFTLVRGSNRAGGFLRLGAADQERKTFYIFLPRGQRDKRGWLAMAEMIRQMEELVGRRMEPQEVWAGGKPSTEKSYAEAVLGSNRKVTSVIKLKVSREEMDGNLQKLQQCLVASWKPSTKEDEDLERLGNLWAYSWGLKGRLGLAKLERGRALLEFEDKREAYRVASSGSREVGGVSLGLDFWKPQTGCWAEEERAQDAWVRIFGLPVSLWSPAILKKIGEECGGFVEIDERTRLMEEIQWARIRVKITGETRPSMLEIEVEEEFYSLVLWWEIRPVVRRLLSAVEIRRRTEDRGDALSRAEKRMGSVLLDTGIEGQFLPVDGRLLQENGSGLESRSQTHGSRSREWACVDGYLNGPPSHGSSLGLTEQEKGGGLAKRDGSLGRKLKDKLKMAVVPEAGPSSTCWASGLGCLSSAVMDGLEREGPKDVQEKAGLLGCSLSRKRPFPEDVLTCWVPEESRREQRVDGLSTTDCALQEEAKRYALHSYTKGNQAMGTSLLLSSNFDQAPEGESFDRSGELEEELGGDKSTWLTVYEGSVGASGIQASENVKGELWEECSLAKFSQVLGFSTEGIEKEIVNFLTKIRKRREKIHSKELLEKTKFERELKRLECSVNYEGGNKQKALSQGKGNQLIVVQ